MKVLASVALLALLVVPASGQVHDGFEGCTVPGAAPPGWFVAEEGAMACDATLPLEGDWAAKLSWSGEGCLPLELEAGQWIDVALHASSVDRRVTAVVVGLKDASFSKWLGWLHIYYVPFGYRRLAASFRVPETGRYGVCVGRWHYTETAQAFVDEVTVGRRPVYRAYLPMVARSEL